MVGASMVIVELAWLEVLCSLPLRANGRVEPGRTVIGGVESAADSMSIGASNGTADWLNVVWNRVWSGRGTSSFDPNVTENVGIG
jgi:hypothetical protein